MKYQISQVSIQQSSLVVAILYGVIGLVFVVFSILMALLDPEGTGIFVLVSFCFPIFYFVFGLILSAIMFWIYNLIAGRIGGIEFYLKEIQP